MRSRLLQRLDLWSHRGHDKGREQTWLDRLLCDAWEYHVTAGDCGRRAWPLTKWKYDPWYTREVYCFREGRRFFVVEDDQPPSHL